MLARAAPPCRIRLPPKAGPKPRAAQMRADPSAVGGGDPPQPNVSPAPLLRQTSGRGLTLRGCLIGVVLVIALIVAAVFVVPAVVLILQEEQAQPSINEPRIR